MRGYLLKEYGSWSVMIISYLTGLFVSEGAGLKDCVALIPLSILTNSKQAFTLWRRQSASKEPLMVFLSQIIIASLVLIAIFGDVTMRLLPYCIFPAVYLLFFMTAGEHFIMTEIFGFSVLTLSALIAKCAVTGIADYALYSGVALFFIAGVLKVRVQLKKRVLERIVMMGYVVFTTIVYYFLHIPLVILFPLIDNLIFPLALYRVKLSTTGWIEVLKGVLFIFLMSAYY